MTENTIQPDDQERILRIAYEEADCLYQRAQKEYERDAIDTRVIENTRRSRDDAWDAYQTFRFKRMKDTRKKELLAAWELADTDYTRLREDCGRGLLSGDELEVIRQRVETARQTYYDHCDAMEGKGKPPTPPAYVACHVPYGVRVIAVWRHDDGCQAEYDEYVPCQHLPFCGYQPRIEVYLRKDALDQEVWVEPASIKGVTPARAWKIVANSLADHIVRKHPSYQEGSN